MKRKPIIIAAVVLVIIIGAAGGALLGYIHKNAQTNPPEHQANQQPTPASPPPYVDEVLSKMSLHDKVSSLFILHTPGTDQGQLASYLSSYKPGGLIFMGDNIPDTINELHAQTTVIMTDKKLPPFIATDEEGDTVTRLAADTFPGPEELRNQPPSATKDAYARRSDLLKNAGINLNFGIIADVTANADSFIYPRVLGTTPQAASERVAQAVEGSKGKTLTTIKHFPGHGETGEDSHQTIPTAPTTYDDWRNRVALPFKAGIDAGADMVMFGHLRYSAVDSQPATLSKKWHDIIRNDLGFKGVIITDDMMMLQNSGEAAYADSVVNAVSALQAGADVLLYVLDHETAARLDPNTLIEGVVAAVNDGRIDAKSIDDRVHKLLVVRHSFAQ